MATLTCAGSSVHEGAITPVMEEEVGPILVVTEDIRGTAAEDGAHADTPASWKKTLNHSRWQKQSPGSVWRAWLPLRPSRSRNGMTQESLEIGWGGTSDLLQASLSPDLGSQSHKPLWRVTSLTMRQMKSKIKSLCAKGTIP